MLASGIFMSTFSVQAIDVKGVVIDKSTNEPLIGATVQIEGTNTGVVTDIDGKFELDNVKEKSILIIQYVAYEPQRIIVSKNLNGEMTVAMSTDNQQLDEVTVVARKNLEGERALMMERQKSSVAIENLGAKEMSTKGISNVEEGVKKITGISVASSGQIIVRGLGDRYSITTLNGMPIASPNPDNKLIPLDLFPASTVKNITVNKVYSPADYADYSGAHIDIATKDHTGEDFFNLSLSTGGYTNTLGKDFMEMEREGTLFTTPRMSKEVSGMSLVEFEEYSKNNRAFKTGFDVNKRTALPALGGKLSFGKNFQLNNGNALNILASLSINNDLSSMKNSLVRTLEASEGKTRSEFIYDSYTAELETAGLASLIYTFRQEDHIGYTMFYARNAENEFMTRRGYDKEKVELTGINDIMHVYALQNHQIDGFHKINSKWNFKWQASLSSTSSSEPDRRQMMFEHTADGNLKLFDLNQQETMRYFGSLTEDEYTVSLKSEYNIDNRNKLDFGIAYKNKTRKYEGTRFYYNITALNETIDNIEDIYHTSDFFTDSNFSDGTVSITKLKQPRDSYDSGSDITSAYFNADIRPTEKFLINAGVRYEFSRQYVDYYNDQSRKEKRELNNHNLFPAVNLKYDLNNTSNLRFSLSRTVTRPSFIEMAPFLYEESYGSAQIRGNENLKNGYNYNADFRYEMIDNGGNMISATVYYKFLQNPIERTQQIAGGATMHSFNNADNGMAAGVEIEARKAIIKDLQIGANASYMYTNVILPERGAYTNSNRALQGASPYLANADITWTPQLGKKGKLSIALLYNLQGPRIHSVGVSGLGDVIQLPVHTMNMVASYTPNSHFQISLKATDLLNRNIIFEQEIPMTGNTVEVEKFKKGTKLEIGLSYKF